MAEAKRRTATDDATSADWVISGLRTILVFIEAVKVAPHRGTRRTLARNALVELALAEKLLQRIAGMEALGVVSFSVEGDEPDGQGEGEASGEEADSEAATRA